MGGVDEEKGSDMPSTSKALDMVFALEWRQNPISFLARSGHLREHATARTGAWARVANDIEALLLGNLAHRVCA